MVPLGYLLSRAELDRVRLAPGSSSGCNLTEFRGQHKFLHAECQAQQHVL